VRAAYEPFFVKMWPAYDSEFETPGLRSKKCKHIINRLFK
jgi:hypothetical protein